MTYVVSVEVTVVLVVLWNLSTKIFQKNYFSISLSLTFWQTFKTRHLHATKAALNILIT